MEHDVFICHSSKDKSVAEAVCATLEARDIRCWISPRDVVPGTDYASSIVDAIASSKVVVLVFSSHSNESGHVGREIERAVSHGVPILPFRVEAVEPSPALEYYISVSHWLDAFTPPLEAHLDHLAGTIHLLIGRSEAEEPVTAPTVEAALASAAPAAGSRWTMHWDDRAVVAPPGSSASEASTSEASTSEAPASPAPVTPAAAAGSSPRGRRRWVVAAVAVVALAAGGVALATRGGDRCEPRPGADLAGCDLTGRDLEGADLDGIDLRDAVLADADLSGASLRDADLSGADLRDADLSGADLRDADLSRADLGDAALDDVDLTGARGLTDDQLLDALDVPAEALAGEASLRGILTDDVDDILDAATAVREGRAVDGAAGYVESEAFHPAVVIGPDPEAPIPDWAVDLQGAAEPTGIRFTELVVVVGEERWEAVEVCPYFVDGEPAPSITRYQQAVSLQIHAAATGEIVASRSFLGAEPRACGPNEPFDLTEIFGDPVDLSVEAVAWIEGVVHPPRDN